MFELTYCISQGAVAEIPTLGNGFGTGNPQWLLILAERLAIVMIAQRAQDAQLLLNVTSSIGTPFCYLHSSNERRLRWRPNPSERCLSPASPGLASAHKITVVGVRIQLRVCASLTTSTPAWHFCLHKRHHRLSIRLSMDKQWSSGYR